MSFPGAGRTGQAETSAGTAWDRQAGGYHRFFSQFTIPVAHPLLDAARVTAGSTVLDAGAPGTPPAPPVPAAPGWSPSTCRRPCSPAPGTRTGCCRWCGPTPGPSRSPTAPSPPWSPASTCRTWPTRPPRPPNSPALAPGGWLAVSVWDVPARARHTGLLADAIAEVTGSPPPAPAVPAGRLRELLQAAGLSHAESSTLRWVHPVPSARALWDGLLASPVAAAATVLRATPATRHRIHQRFLALATALTDPHGTVRLPVSAVIIAGQRPSAGGPRRPRGHWPTAASACRPSPGTP